MKLRTGITQSLPNFFIVGAPKCGTTSLSRWLSEHANVFISVPKEPHYYNVDMKCQRVRSEGQYKRLFRYAGSHHLARGEASTWYLYSDVAVPRIESLCEKPRYIAMVRNPIDMAQSLYLHNKRHCHESAPTFEEAWRLQENRWQGRGVPRHCRDVNFLMYGRACSLGTLLARLFQRTARDRVLVLVLDDLFADPGREYRRVLEFLGLPDDGRTAFPRNNEARRPRSPRLQRLLINAARMKRLLGIHRNFGVLSWNEQKTTKMPLPAATTAELQHLFAPEIDLLENLLDRDLWAWRTAGHAVRHHSQH